MGVGPPPPWGEGGGRVITDPPYKNGGGRRAVSNQRVCDFADPPTEDEGGGNPKKVAQCKRVKFGGRRAGPTRQYNSRGVQWGANPAIRINKVGHSRASRVSRVEKSRAFRVSLVSGWVCRVSGFSRVSKFSRI